MARDDRLRWEARYREGAAALAAAAPSPFLAAHAHLLRGRVLDVAAGAGRNALFLARRGCLVHAVDIAFAGLEAAASVARRDGLPLHCLQADLESLPLPDDHYDAVVNIRFLHRPLLPLLRRTVRPGGIVVFETFLADQAAAGHPRNPAFLLERGELARAFAGFTFLVLEEGRCDDASGPAWLGRAVARRPHSLG